MERAAFLILTIMAVGLTVVQNYDKMKEMEQTVEDLRQTSTEASGLSIQVSAGAITGTETETESSTQTEMASSVLDSRLPASITAAMETEKESGTMDEMTEKTTDAAETKQTESETDWTGWNCRNSDDRMDAWNRKQPADGKNG